MEKEDYVFVLDYLPEGRYTDYKHSPLVQGIGTERFSLLAMVPKPEAKFEPLEKVFVGKGERDKVALVKGVMSYSELTEHSKSCLERVVEKMVGEKKDKFLQFYNKSGAVSVRLHTLELLPGIGRKHFQELLAERQKKPFESLEDVNARLKNFPNSKKVLVDRIMQELKGEEKYYLFVRPPKEARQRW